MKKNKYLKFLLVLLIISVLFTFSACDDKVETEEAVISYFENISGLEDSYEVDSVLDYNLMTVTVVYTNGMKKNVELSDEKIDIEKLPDMSTAGDKEIFVTIDNHTESFGFKVFEPDKKSSLGTPQNLQAKGNILTWNVVSNAGSYEIFMNDKSIGTSNTNSFNFTIDDTAEIIKFKVRALPEANTNYTISRFSEEFVLVDVIKLNAPTNVRIENKKICWNSPTLEEGISSEKIHYVVKLDYGIIAGNIDGAEFDNQYNILKETSIQISKLNISPKTNKNAEPYKISIVAYSTENQVLRSNESEAVDFLPYILNAPNNLKIDDTKLMWDAVESATSYVIINGYNKDNTPNIIANVKTNLFDIPNNYFDDIGGYDFSIIAKGNGFDIFDSFASEAINFSVIKLTTPQNVIVNGNELSWTSVNNATGYEIFSNDKIVTKTQNTNIEIDFIKDIGDYLLKIKAVSDKITVKESDFSQEVSYICKQKLETPKLTKNEDLIEWKCVENADYYILKCGNEIIENEITECYFDLESLVNLSYGKFDLHIVAVSNSKYRLNSKSSNTIDYIKILKLSDPKINYDNGFLTWDDVIYDGKSANYEISFSGQKVCLENNQISIDDNYRKSVITDKNNFDLNTYYAGCYNVSIRAISEDQEIYPYSDYIAVVSEFTIDFKLESPQNIKAQMPYGVLAWDNNPYAIGYKLEMFDSNNEIICLEDELEFIITNTNSYVINSDLLSIGEYTIKITSRIYDGLPEYVNSSDAKTYTYTTKKLVSPNLEIGKLNENGIRHLTWDNVEDAVGYCIRIKNTKTDEVTVIGHETINNISDVMATVGFLDGVEWVKPATEYSLSIEEYAFQPQIENYEFLIYAVGNGRNLYSSEQTKIEYAKPLAEGAPENLRMEHGVLKWDAVPGAYDYKLTIKTQKKVDPDTQEISWGTVNTIATFNTYYDALVADIDYLIEIQFSIKNEDNLDKIYSEDTAIIEFIINAPPNSVKYENGFLKWDGICGYTYKICIGEYTETIICDKSQIMGYDVLAYAENYIAGRLNMGVAVLQNGDEKLDSIFNMADTFLTKLENPKLEITDGKISWNQIQFADNYIITIDGEKFDLTSNEIDFSMTAGEHVITIFANVDAENYIDSDLVSETVYKLTVPDVKVGDGYLYWEVKDDAEYIGENKLTGEKQTAEKYTVDNIVYAKINIVGSSGDYKVYATKENCFNSDIWQNLPSDVPEFDVGNGSSGSPYEIHSVEQLKNLGKYEGHYKLVTSIDMKGNEWKPIVFDENRVLDGNNLTISNFKITQNYSNNAGLFSKNNGIIKNLNIKNANIRVNNVEDKPFVAGGLAGYNNGIISNCHIENGLVRGAIRAGGLVGKNIGLIEKSGADIEVNTNASGNSSCAIGGLVGENYNGSVLWSYSLGDIYSNASCSYLSAGGLVGIFDVDGDTKSKISACYSYSNMIIKGLSSTVNVGGFIGQSRIKTNINNCLSKGNININNKNADVYMGGFIGKSGGLIKNCISLGKPVVLNANTSVIGGFLGNKIGVHPENCFYNTETSEIPEGNALTQGKGLNNYQFKQTINFKEFSSEFWNIAGRDLDDGGICENGLFYPHLIGEKCYMEINEQNENGKISWKYSNNDNAFGSIHNPIIVDEIIKLSLLNNEITDWCFRQVCDIDFENQEFIPTPIFTANYNGNGFAFKNLQNTANNEHEYIGFIAKNYGNIYNLGIENIYFNNTNTTNDLYIGGITGYNGSGVINGCYVIHVNESGSITAKSEKGTSFVGGLVGFNNNGIIKNSYSRISVAGSSYTAKQGHLGGLIGRNNMGEVRNCYSASSVNAGSANTFTGGLIGKNYSNDTVNIFDCYYDCDVAKCYDDLSGLPKTTFEMQSDNPFENWQVATETKSGWVFELGKYPIYLVK